MSDPRQSPGPWSNHPPDTVFLWSSFEREDSRLPSRSGAGERTTTGAYWDDSTGSTTNRELTRVCGASCGNFGSVPGLGAVDIPDPREHSALQIADVRVAGLDQDS